MLISGERKEDLFASSFIRPKGCLLNGPPFNALLKPSELQLDLFAQIFLSTSTPV